MFLQNYLNIPSCQGRSWNHIQNSVLCVNPKLVTSKKNKAEHGLGIPTVREIVNQYQGFLNISEEANNVIVHMVIPLANFAKNR